MDQLDPLLTQLQENWQTRYGGALRLSSSPPGNDAVSAPVYAEDEAIGWLIGSPGNQTSAEDASLLLDSWALLLSQLVSTQQLASSLTDELIAAWDHLSFLNQLTGLLRDTSDAWQASIESLELAMKTVGAQNAFIIQKKDDDLVSRFLGSTPPSDDIHTIATALLQVEGKLVCSSHTDCRNLLHGIEDLDNFIGQQLNVVDIAPIFIGILNHTEGHFTAGDIQLFDSLVEQLTTVFDVEALHVQQMRAQRINRELELASEVQKNFLPDHLPAIEGYEIASRLISASEIGGDFYDVMQRGDNPTAVLVCDIAGKGISAALLAADVRAAIRSELFITPAPGAALTNTNARLFAEMARVERFATMVLVSLPTVKDKMPLYASAGHPPILWFQAEENQINKLPSTTIPLGILKRTDNRSVPIPLDPGDILLLYSDGLTESENKKGEFLNLSRVCSALLAAASAPPDVILDMLIAARNNHLGDVPAFDDLTMIAVRKVEEQPVPRARYYAPLCLTSDLESLDDAHTQLDRLQRFLLQDPALEQWGIRVHLALIESFTNIMTHAYQDGEFGVIYGLLALHEDRLIVDLIDRGKPFIEAETDALSEVELDEMREGGYGLNIIHDVMDHVSYQRLPDAYNHWQLTRYLPGGVQLSTQ